MANANDNTDAIKAALARLGSFKAKLILEMPLTEVLVRKVRFPTTTPEQLRRTLSREILVYELDRITPFQAQDLYYDFRILPITSKSHLDVELSLVRKLAADQALQHLKNLGATAEAIQWPGSWNNANLLPPNLRRQVTNLSLLINVTLGILVLAMLIAVSISPILQKRA
ncbi:hypothetical protein TI04_13520, partial [Achromatium sp. WMS2]